MRTKQRSQLETLLGDLKKGKQIESEFESKSARLAFRHWHHCRGNRCYQYMNERMKGVTYSPAMGDGLVLVVVKESNCSGVYADQVSASGQKNSSRAKIRGGHCFASLCVGGHYRVEWQKDTKRPNTIESASFASRSQEVTSTCTTKMAANEEYTDEEVEEVFDEATTLIMSSKIPMPDEQLLVFYGLYKQATVGKCNTDKPGFFDFKGKAKWCVH